MDFKCKKCGSKKYMIRKNCSQTGLYCSDCGKWYKWLNKNEVRVYSESNTTEESKENANDLKRIIDQLKEFTDYLDKVIDRELMKEPLSEGDSIRKCAYCTALERDKNALLNIINGKDWRSTE